MFHSWPSFLSSDVSFCGLCEGSDHTADVKSFINLIYFVLLKKTYSGATDLQSAECLAPLKIVLNNNKCASEGPLTPVLSNCQKDFSYYIY